MAGEMKDILGKKYWFRLPFNAVVGAVILTLIGTLMVFLRGLSVTYASIIGMVATILIIILALVWHKGQEKFWPSLVSVLISVAIIEVISIWIPRLTYAVEIGTVNGANVLSAIGLLIAPLYLADGIFNRYIKKRVKA